MTVFLNVLFVLVSVFYLTGRLYEIGFIMDIQTGLFDGKGIVTTPVMMVIICIIAVCCGVIIFSSEKHGKKIRQMPVGILGIMAGVFFVVGGIVNSVNCFRYGGFILYHIMETVGGIGLILLGIMNIRGKSKEKVPVVLTLLIPVGVCLNSILHEVKTIRDTEYLMRSLAGVFSLIFLMLLFKTAYAPGKISKMLLYIFSLINFVFTGVGSFAAVLGGIMTGTVSFPQLLYNVGFIFMGLYAIFIAFFISPSKIEYDEDDPEEEPVPQRKIKHRQKPEEKKAEQEEYNFGRTGNINQAAIDELFARKDAREQQYSAAEKVSAPKEKTAEIYMTKPAEVKQETEAEKTTVISAPKEKAVFKSSGQKPATKKIVYKAPK